MADDKPEKNPLADDEDVKATADVPAGDSNKDAEITDPEFDSKKARAGAKRKAAAKGEDPKKAADEADLSAGGKGFDNDDVPAQYEDTEGQPAQYEA